MPDSTASQINKLTSALKRLRPSQLHWVEKVTEALLTPGQVELLRRGLLDEVSVLDFGDVLRIHHVFSAEPFTKDKFEYALVQVITWRGLEATLAPKGNPGHDATVSGERLSFKTQADKHIKSDSIWISKFMELGKGVWGGDPNDLEALRRAFLDHLRRYDRIFTLRALGRSPEWHYELVEIPKKLLSLATTGELEMKMNSRQNPKPGYCHVYANDRTLLFQLYFDAGSERKLQVKALRKSECIVHAEWRFNVPLL